MLPRLSKSSKTIALAVGILLSVPWATSGQSSSSSKTYGTPRAQAKAPSSPGRYRSEGRYRSQTQNHRHFQSNRYRPRAQPGSLLPGNHGYGYRQNPTPYQRPHQPYSHGYGYSSPGYVVYVPSSDDVFDTSDSGHAAQPLDGTFSSGQQPIYIVVQAPEPQRVVEQAPAPAPPPAVAPPPPAPPKPVSREPGEVQLVVRPSDALILLDDRELGTAAELKSFDSSLSLSPGVYVLEVTHGQHASQRLMFDVQPGKPVIVEVDLMAKENRQRTRLTKPDDLPLFLGKQ